jgi:ERCC4-related helicase
MLFIELTHLQELLEKLDVTANSTTTADKDTNEYRLLSLEDPPVHAAVRRLIETVFVGYVPEQFSMTGITEKVTKLIKAYQVLPTKLEKDQEFRCLTFVDRRLTARALLEVVRSCDDLKDTIKPALLLGKSDPTASVDSVMNFKRQNQVIYDLRTGRCNLLFATSIAEEGNLLEHLATSRIHNTQLLIQVSTSNHVPSSSALTSCTPTSVSYKAVVALDRKTQST